MVTQNELDALMSGQHPKEETAVSNHDLSPGAADPKVVSGKWVCAQSSESKSSNFNKHITDKLEVLAKAYTHQGDKWRALSYSKAVNALKSYHKPVASYQVVCSMITNDLAFMLRESRVVDNRKINCKIPV